MTRTYGASSSGVSRGRSGLFFRWGELASLLAASAVVSLGLWLTFQAKTTNPVKTPFTEAEERLKSKQLFNLNRMTRAEDLSQFLTIFEGAERDFAAQKVFEHFSERGKHFANVGELAKVRVERGEVEGRSEFVVLNRRLAVLRAKEAEPNFMGAPGKHITLFTAGQVARLKASFVVRGPEEFREQLWRWALVSILLFYAVHFGWAVFNFRGDQFLLPLIHLLSGTGLILMVSLRDPLRDMLSFRDFAAGLLLGGALLFISSLCDHRRLFGSYAVAPLLLALGLSGLLLLYGTGPGASDAKVNLWGTQPVEFVKILVVFFLAGYFSNNWEPLREFRERALTRFGWHSAPPLRYLLPVIFAVGSAIAFFFLQKDLGPALVLGCTFLALYSVARKQFALAGLGLAVLLVGFWISYQLAFPLNVYQRIRIWLSPWENGLRNGDQIAHAWWALATGNLTGTGLGLGDPAIIPAGHTDLVLASLGEELGFVGVTVVLLGYALLLARAMRIARCATNDYSFFLALGLTLITGLQIALITGGVLGLLPLSGVVSPFLSYGKSSMAANSLIFGLLLSVSARRAGEEAEGAFQAPMRALSLALAVIIGSLFVRAAYVQVWLSDDHVVAPVLTKLAESAEDKDANPYVYLYNPRVLEAERRLPRGTVYDRNGIPLATGDWNELERHRPDYERLGVNIDESCERADRRHYPFGARLFHLLGDARTRANWGAPNSNYVERDYAGRLRGFEDRVQVVLRTVTEVDPRTKTLTSREVRVLRRDFRELLPLVRYRYRPGHPGVEALLQRERDVRMSIDIRLQLRLDELMRAQLSALKKDKGAAVVLDPATGDLLASVSYPHPQDRVMASGGVNDDNRDSPESLFDRARFGEYPPGSTFKIVTSAAALHLDPTLSQKGFGCKALGGGRVGNHVEGWGRPVRDDVGDHAPHGTVAMRRGIVQSCNAYFAQLGVYEVGAQRLFETAELFGLAFTKKGIFSMGDLSSSLQQASYGQAPILATPFQMARVAATVGNDGRMPYGRWVTDDSNQRTQGQRIILAPAPASFIAEAMRGVVTEGTARRLQGSAVPVAGKTGTAEVEGARSHSWFIGFAPYRGRRKVAFAVLIENGGYGGTAAAPLAGSLVRAANELGLVQ